MKLNQALEEKKLDLRVRDRLISEGIITSSDVQTYLKNLEDDSKNFIALGSRAAAKESNE